MPNASTAQPMPYKVADALNEARAGEARSNKAPDTNRRRAATSCPAIVLAECTTWTRRHDTLSALRQGRTVQEASMLVTALSITRVPVLVAGVLSVARSLRVNERDERAPRLRDRRNREPVPRPGHETRDGRG